jgi:competence protein ComEA
VLSLFLLVVLAGVTHGQDKPDAAKRLDLNKATAEELDTLPEVGPKLAKAIVAFREKSGPFRRVEDLLAVPGISKRRLEKIRPHVYVEPPKRESGSAPPGAA